MPAQRPCSRPPRRAALPQQLQLPHRRVASRRSWSRAPPAGYGARHHRRVLARRRGARAHGEAKRRSAAVVGAEIRSTLPAASSAKPYGGAAPATRPAGAAGAVAPRLRQPVGWITVARRRAAKGSYLALIRPTWKAARRTPTLAGLRLPGCFAPLVPQTDAGVRADLCSRTRCGSRLVRRRTLRDRRRAAAPRRRRAARRDRRTRGRREWPAIAAAGGVRMHVRSRKPLQDALVATHLGLPVAQCGFALAQRRGAPASRGWGCTRAPGSEAHGRHRRELRLRARRAALRVPARDRPRRPHAGQLAARAHRIRARCGAIPAACPTRCARSSSTSWR